MATKKLEPVKSKTATDEAILIELKDLNETMKVFSKYLDRMDWKLWMMMNMMRLIGEENGYSFKEIDPKDKDTKEEINE